MKTTVSLALVSTLLLSAAEVQPIANKHAVDLKVLFIGNSHTYVNSMPKMFAE